MSNSVLPKLKDILYTPISVAPIAFLIIINGNSILPISQAKNLGVTFHFTLSFIPCIQSVSKSFLVLALKFIQN